MAAYQAPLSLGFSRQEHWSGLPFPSPMHKSEKGKWGHSVMSDSATPWTAAYQAPLCLGFSRQEYWSGLPLPSLNIYCRLSYMAFTMWRKLPSMPIFWRVLIMNVCWILSKAFCASIEIIIWFCFFRFLFFFLVFWMLSFVLFCFPFCSLFYFIF